MSPHRYKLVDAVVVPDPTAALRGELATPQVAMFRGAVVTSAPGLRYVFTAEEWRKLADEVSKRRWALSTAQIERMIATRGRHARVVEPGEEADGPAIVMAGEEIVGAWTPAHRLALIGAAAAAIADWKASHRRTGGSEAPAPDQYVEAGPSPEPAPMSAEPPVPNPDRAPSPPPAPGPPPPPQTGAPNGGGAPKEDSEMVRRTPHLDVPGEPLAAGQTVTVEVYTDTENPRPGEVVEGISLEGNTLDLYVWLLVSEHFNCDGEPVRPFRIERSKPRSASVEYEVRVVDNPRADTQPSIAAVFFHQGRQAGKVERRVRVAGVAEASPPPGRREPEPEPEPEGVGAERRPSKPDLTVAISRSGQDQSWECAVTTPHLDAYVKPVTARWPFPRDAAPLINQRMEKFAEKGLTPLTRKARLVGAGKALYEDAPELFAKVYKDLVAEEKPLDSILIATEEAAFPWELLVPDDGDQPLGARHALGRWTHPRQFPTEERVAVRDGWVIAPDYPVEKRKLDHAEPEVKYVRETFNCEAVDPPSIERLNADLGERPVGLLHFVCHGAAPDGRYAQSLYLLREDDEGKIIEEELDDEMLLGLPGVAHGIRKGTPLVFLNACEAGRQIPSLMGTAGMAKAFITGGALGVIAPLWRVRDELAAQIAIDIYKAAIDGKGTPLADIVRDVRARTYDEPAVEDSFAAYCFFGDPHTRLERVEGN